MNPKLLFQFTTAGCAGMINHANWRPDWLASLLGDSTGIVVIVLVPITEVSLRIGRCTFWYGTLTTQLKLFGKCIPLLTGVNFTQGIADDGINKLQHREWITNPVWER